MLLSHGPWLELGACRAMDKEHDNIGVANREQDPMLVVTLTMKQLADLHTEPVALGARGQQPG